jgi:hypothetical protein
MATKLSLLRVSAEMDASGYARGMAEKVAADQRGVSSGNDLAASLAKQDVTAGNAGGAIGRLSKTYIDGYGSAAKFYAGVNSLQKQLELGNVSGEKAALIYQGMTKQFGMVAIASDIAGKGNADFAKIVADVNGKVNTNVVALNTAATAHAGLSTQAMAAQHSVRGFTEMIIQGVPPTQALAMEMNNLTYAASGPGGLTGALKDGIGVFTRLLTPMTLMIGIPAAIAGGFYLLYNSIKAGEIEFANLGDRIGATIQQLHGLQSNAALSAGIGQSDFLQQMERFGDLVGDAQHGLGSMAELFRANGVQAKSFTDYLAKAADLIANTTREEEKYRLIKQLGLPATFQWVQYLSQGGDAIRDAADQANGFGSKAEKEMIERARQFDTAWSRSWQAFKDYSKSTIIEVAQGLQGLIDKGTGWLAKMMQGAAQGLGAGKGSLLTYFGSQMSQGTANSFYDAIFGPGGHPGAAGPPSNPTINDKDLQHQLQLEAQHIQMLGEMATVQEKVRLKEIEIQQARLSGVAVTQQAEQALLNYTRAQEESNRAQATIAALGSAATVTEQYDAKVKALVATLASGAITQETFNRAVAGLKVDQDIQLLQNKISALGDLAMPAQKYELTVLQLRQQLQQGAIDQQTFNTAIANADPLFKNLTDAAGNFATSFTNAIAQGKNSAVAFRGALSDVGRQLMSLGQQNLTSGIKTLFSGGGLSGFDPVSLGLGAAGMGLSMLFGQSEQKKAEEEAHRAQVEAAKQAWARMEADWKDFLGKAQGQPLGNLQKSLFDIQQQADQFWQAILQKADAHGADRPPEIDQAEKAMQQSSERAVKSFLGSWQAVIDALNSGLGMDSPFVSAVQNVQSLADSVEGFISDTQSQAGGWHALYDSDVPKAVAAAKNYILSLLQTQEPLSDVQKNLQAMHGTAKALQQALVDLGMTADQAASAIAAGVTQALVGMRESFTADLQGKINAASGKGYLNDVSDAVKQAAQSRADAAALGLSSGLSDKFLSVSAQKIVDDAGLIGPAFNDLIKKFPELTGVVHAATGVLDASTADIQSKLNSLNGKDYLNQITDLIKQVHDLSTQGVDPHLLNRYFLASAQSVVDGAQLTGKAFNDLKTQFPELTNALGNTLHAYSAAAADAQSKTQALQKDLASLSSATANIRGYLNQLVGGSNSPLSPVDRMSEAGTQFNQQLALAQGGDTTALGGITQYSQAYLDAAKAYYGSSQQYQSIFNSVFDALGQLPNQAASSNAMVDALNSILTAQLAGNDVLNRIDTNGDGVVSNTEAMRGRLDIANAVLQALDANGDNLLSRSEVANTQLADIFDTLDVNGDGTISRLDLLNVGTQAVNTTTSGLLTRAQLAALGLSTDAKVSTLLTQQQVSALGLSRDTTVGGLLTQAQLSALGLSTDAKVSSLLTQQQLAALGLSRDATTGNLLTQAQLQSSGLSTESSAAAAAGTLGNVVGPNAVTTTANGAQTVSGVNLANSLLDAIKQLNATSSSQLQLLNAQFTNTFLHFTATRGGGETISVSVNNSMLTALNKIVYNTYAIAYNTSQNMSPGSSLQYTISGALWGTYARGGYVTGPGTGTSDSIPTLLSNGEYVMTAAAVRALGLPLMDAINAGRIPAMPVVANDNSALVAELRALRAEVADLRRENSRYAQANMAGLIAVRDGIDTGNAYADETRKRMHRVRAS